MVLKQIRIKSRQILANHLKIVNSFTSFLPISAPAICRSFFCIVATDERLSSINEDDVRIDTYITKLTKVTTDYLSKLNEYLSRIPESDRHHMLAKQEPLSDISANITVIDSPEITLVSTLTSYIARDLQRTTNASISDNLPKIIVSTLLELGEIAKTHKLKPTEVAPDISPEISDTMRYGASIISLASENILSRLA